MQSLKYIRTRVRIGLIVYFCALPYRTNIMWAAISNLLKNFAIHSVYFFDPFRFPFSFSLKSILEMNDRIETSFWNPTEICKRGKLQYKFCFFRKGCLISESFPIRVKSPKINAKSLSRASSLRMVIWHPFLEILEIWVKVKIFLRLSYLYVKTFSTNFAKI